MRERGTGGGSAFTQARSRDSNPHAKTMRMQYQMKLYSYSKLRVRRRKAWQAPLMEGGWWRRGERCTRQQAQHSIDGHALCGCTALTRQNKILCPAATDSLEAHEVAHSRVDVAKHLHGHITVSQLRLAQAVQNRAERRRGEAGQNVGQEGWTEAHKQGRPQHWTGPHCPRSETHRTTE